MRVSAICHIDEYDPQTNKTKDGMTLLRYVFGTECGELYMLAFDLTSLFKIQSNHNASPFDCNNFIIVEYLGSKLS